MRGSTGPLGDRRSRLNWLRLSNALLEKTMSTHEEIV